MRFIGSVIEKLQRHPKRIVFPEGTEPRVIQAARQFYALRLGAPPSRLGIPDEKINVRVYVRDQLKRRLEAGACHRSQGGSNRPPTLWSRIFQRRISGVSPWDNFIQAYPPPPPGAPVKADLFLRNGAT